MQKWEVIVQDFKVALLFSWGIFSSTVFRWAGLYLCIDVSRPPIGHEYGADRPSRNVCSKLLTCASYCRTRVKESGYFFIIVFVVLLLFLSSCPLLSISCPSPPASLLLHPSSCRSSIPLLLSLTSCPSPPAPFLLPLLSLSCTSPPAPHLLSPTSSFSSPPTSSHIMYYFYFSFLYSPFLMSLLNYFLLVLLVICFFYYSFSFFFLESTYLSFYCPSLAAAWDVPRRLNERLQPPDDA